MQITLEKSYRQRMIASYRKTLKLQKISRVGAMKEHKVNNTTKELIERPAATSANAHLLALVFLNKDYQAMLKSFSTPQAFWSQMIRLTNEFAPADYSKEKTKVSLMIGEVFVNTPNPGKGEVEEIVKVFNNGKYDRDIAFLMGRKLPQVLIRCIQELSALEAAKAA